MTVRFTLLIEEAEEPSEEPILSTPLECARTCVKGEPPKICYYKFTLEIYSVLGPLVEIFSFFSQSQSISDEELQLDCHTTIW